MNLTATSEEVNLSLSPCDHEEADTRIFLHLKSARVTGHTSLLIRMADSDVVVLALHNLGRIPGIEELWVQLGTTKPPKVYAIHDLYSQIGQSMANGLPFFHVISGCDQVGGLVGYAKKSFWSTWMSSPFINIHFARLSHPDPPAVHIEAAIVAVEKFVCKM